MNALDDFSTYYSELLEGRYDCVDRMVLNAYYPPGQTGGGLLRCWWREMYGDDSTLDDKHLTEMVSSDQAVRLKIGASLLFAHVRLPRLFR